MATHTLEEKGVQQDTHQRSEPLLASSLPEYPWQVVGSDLFKLKGTISWLWTIFLATQKWFPLNHPVSSKHYQESIILLTLGTTSNVLPDVVSQNWYAAIMVHNMEFANFLSHMVSCRRQAFHSPLKVTARPRGWCRLKEYWCGKKIPIWHHWVTEQLHWHYNIISPAELLMGRYIKTPVCLGLCLAALLCGIGCQAIQGQHWAVVNSSGWNQIGVSTRYERGMPAREITVPSLPSPSEGIHTFVLSGIGGKSQCHVLVVSVKVLFCLLLNNSLYFETPSTGDEQLTALW